MLDLSTLTKFKSDIEGNHVTAYPLIIIGADTDNPLYISTIKETLLDEEGGTPLIFKDYNLKISNIKESVNLESHVIKISNVSITLSNYEQNGERLSDSLVGDFNVDAHVFYKTQSCTSIQDCLPLYRGTIRRIEHDDKDLKIQLEDLTDSTFHKDVPTANMGTRRNCFNKDYLNRYIPMTYGEVSKAPVIPYIDSIGAQGNYYISIIPDDVENVTGSGRDLSIFNFGSNEVNPELVIFPTADNDSLNPLFIYKDEYFRVLQKYEQDFHNTDGEILYTNIKQYDIDDSRNFLKVEKVYSSGFAQNPPAANEFQAFKLYYPSQAEILKTDIDTGDPGANFSKVINIEASIYNPDAAIDNIEKTSSFIDEDQFSEFATYAEIPGNEVDLDGVEGDLTFTVSNFTPCVNVNERHGIHYPRSPVGGYDPPQIDSWIGTTNYLYLISAWLQVNAHHFERSVKFVSAPTGNMIRDAARKWIRNYDNGWTTDDSGDDFLNETYKVRVVPQYQLDSNFRDAWCAVSGIPNDATHQMESWQASGGGTVWDTNENKWQRFSKYKSGGIGGFHTLEESPEPTTHYYFPPNSPDGGSNYDNLKPSFYHFTWTYDNPNSAWHDTTSCTTYMTNRAILRGEIGNQFTYYPGTVYKIGLIEHDNNRENLTHIYVGQWIPESMPQGASGSTITDESYVSILEEGGNVWKSVWVNLFHDPLYPEIPSLYNMDDFAIFTPTALMEKRWGDDIQNGGNDECSIRTKYYAEWNENEIGTYQGNTINWSSSHVSTEKYAGCYGQAETVSQNDGSAIQEKFLCTATENHRSWFLYIDSDVPESIVFTTLDDNIGEYTLATPGSGLGTRVPRGCFIPCNHMMNEARGGAGWDDGVTDVFGGIVNTFGDAKDTVRVIAGSNTLAESRLGVLFPFSNIISTDVMPEESKTFVYGKFDVHLPEDTGDPVIHNIDGNDEFLVQAYAAETIDSQELDYNAEYFFSNGDGCNLMKIQGDHSVFTGGTDEDPISWVFNDLNTYFEGLDFHEISNWRSPGRFDAISLVYRVNGSPSDAGQSSVQFSTNIHSIGILQFNQFENALNSDMYADVYGRANNFEDSFGDTYKYTNEPLGGINSLIENPTDIIYHMVEKELGQIDIVNRESWINARENSIISRMGFSITDKINSRKLIEGICSNSNLYPRFGNNGEFDFKLLNNTYSSSDVNISIKQRDVMKFSFTRTQIENIVTMVNVKYKKDYAKDEYIKSTGYCDAHDFFGNGDNGRNVIRYTGDTPSASIGGYDYIAQGITRESNILEFESDYIRDYSEAIELRNFLLMQNCNQHTIIKCTLPLKYINIEVGDIVNFDKLNNNTKAYGEDYSANSGYIYRNGQRIYPFFIVTSVSKSSKDIKIECMQLHELERTFTAGAGSLTRRSEKGVMGALGDPSGAMPAVVGGVAVNLNYINEDFTLEDLDIFENILQGYISYLTSEQKQNADFTNDGVVNLEDVNLLLTYLSAVVYEDLPAGDIDASGDVNVADIIAIVGYILGNISFSDDMFDAANLAVDDDVNVADIMAIVNIILE